MARRHEAELKLRLGEKLRRRIERAAARNNHSMNTEILDRLERSFEGDDAERAGAMQAHRDYQFIKRVHESTGEILKAWDERAKDDGEKK
jgi:Arc-like DNA binding domain